MRSTSISVPKSDTYKINHSNKQRIGLSITR